MPSRQAAASAPRAPGPGPARPFVFTFLPQTHLAGGRPTGSPLSSVHSAGAARVSGPLPTPSRSARLHWGPQPSPPSPTQLRSDPGRKGHTLPTRLVCESNGVSCLPIDSHCSALSSRGVDLQRAGDVSVSIRALCPHFTLLTRQRNPLFTPKERRRSAYRKAFMAILHAYYIKQNTNTNKRTTFSRSPGRSRWLCCSRGVWEPFPVPEPFPNAHPEMSFPG